MPVFFFFFRQIQKAAQAPRRANIAFSVAEITFTLFVFCELKEHLQINDLDDGH